MDPDFQKGDLWLPLYIGDYTADTMHLTTIQHGAYLLLIMAYWRAQGPLPADDNHLRSITKTSAVEWRTLKPIIGAFFKISPTTWYHRRIESEMARMRDNLEAKSARSIAANNARWGKARSPQGVLKDSSRTPQGLLKDSLCDPSIVLDESPSPSPSPEKQCESPGRSPASGAVEVGPAQGLERDQIPQPQLGNHPPFESVRAWAKANCPEYSDLEIRVAWDSFEATAVDGIWFYGPRPAGNWTACISSRLAWGRKNSGKHPGPASTGLSGAFATEKTAETFKRAL